MFIIFSKSIFSTYVQLGELEQRQNRKVPAFYSYLVWKRVKMGHLMIFIQFCSNYNSVLPLKKEHKVRKLNFPKPPLIFSRNNL